MRKPVLMLDAPSMSGKTYFIDKYLKAMSVAGYRTVCLSDEQFYDMIVEAYAQSPAEYNQTQLARLKSSYDIIAIDNADIAFAGKTLIEDAAARFILSFTEDRKHHVVISGIGLPHRTSRLYRALKSRAKLLPLSRLKKPKF